jgi:hypothetical protein
MKTQTYKNHYNYICTTENVKKLDKYWTNVCVKNPTPEHTKIVFS